MIKFRCSKCDQKIGVDEEYVGRRIRCNKCNQHSIVPKGTDSQVQPAAASSIQSEKKVDKMSTPSSGKIETICVDCSNCGKQYAVAKKNIGKKLICTECGNNLFLQETDEEPVHKYCDDMPKLKSQSSLQNKYETLKLKDETKECPFCGETILKIAQKCKHCGEFIEELYNSKPLYGVSKHQSNKERPVNNGVPKFPILADIVIIIAILLVVVPLVMPFLHEDSRIFQNSSVNVTEIPTVIKSNCTQVDIIQVLKDGADNAPNAKEKWQDKPVYVKGNITLINDDSISIDTSEGLIIFCYFNNDVRYKLKSLHFGNDVMVYGRMSNIWQGFSLKDCDI